MVTYASSSTFPFLAYRHFNTLAWSSDTLAERNVSRFLGINQLFTLRSLDPSLPRDLGVWLIVKLFIYTLKFFVSDVGVDLSGRDRLVTK